MRGLTIIVADDAPERFRTALSLAAAQAALGGRVRVFCQGAAVALLRRDYRCDGDAMHEAEGLPTLAALLDEALGLGVALIACQSGLQLTNTEANMLDPRIGFGGLVSLLQSLNEDRLVTL